MHALAYLTLDKEVRQLSRSDVDAPANLFRMNLNIVPGGVR